MFLFYLLQQKEKSLLYKCFQAQVQDKIDGDWILQVEDDFKLLNINLTFDQIKIQSKFTFKSFVKKRVQAFAFQCLMEDKENNTKCSSVKFEYFKTQEYLLDSRLTTHQKKILFQMRTAVFPVFHNISFLVEDTLCPCCLMSSDTMEHQLRCHIIQSNTQIISKTQVSIKDIFSTSVDVQANLTILFEQAIKRRKIILDHIK